jgi:hypothetical protein
MFKGHYPAFHRNQRLALQHPQGGRLLNKILQDKITAYRYALQRRYGIDGAVLRSKAQEYILDNDIHYCLINT